MAKSTSACNSILALIFNATAWADLAENDTSGPLTNLYVSLHITDPGAGGLQTTGEATYANYQRLAIVRTTSGWDIPVSGQTRNAALAQFNACNAAGANSINYVAIGKSQSGAGLVLYAGQLGSARTVDDGIQPQFGVGALVVSET
jgi:hypothetical protein